MSFSNGRTSPDRTDRGEFPVFGSNGVIGRTDISNAPRRTTVIGRVGTYCGSLHFAKNASWVTDNAIKAVATAEDEAQFWYYALISADLGRLRSGSGQPLINQRSLNAVELPVPPREDRLAIGEILSALDDKIELNRRMNETLEAMAQAIFRDWFVDFGPTRRKIDGATDPVEIMGGLVSDPERARELADMFPAGLGDDGLPEGWEGGRLENVLELAYGKSLTKSDRRDGPYPVYGSGGIGGWHDTALVRGPSIIVGRKGTVGSLYWEDRDFYPIDTVFFVKSRLPMTFCYYLLQTLGLEGMNTDAAVPGLNRSNAYRLNAPIAPHAIIEAFDGLAGLWRKKIAANAVEINTLAATRDLLLPKLMSGEVRLNAAEAVLDAAQ